MKRTLRRQMRAVLRTMDPDLRHDRSLAACRRMIGAPEWRRAGTVFVYLWTGFGPDSTALVDAAWRDGKVVCVPRHGAEPGQIAPVPIRSWADCAPVERGSLEPIADLPVGAEQVDLVVVPGLAFDRRGGRLGSGSGQFRRFLSRAGPRAFRCGLAFAEQLVDGLPAMPRGEGVDALVTDRARLRF